MFAYCLNNPVNRIDPTGRDSSTDSNGNGIPDYLEQRWREQTIRVKMAQIGEGNYFGYDKKDLYASATTIHFDISKDDAIRFYKSITGNTSGEVLGGLLGLVKGLGDVFGIVNLIDSLANYNDYATYDPKGNVLYLEKGYTVVEISRVYIGMDYSYSASEIEYVIFDNNCTMIFNDLRKISYFF